MDRGGLQTRSTRPDGATSGSGLRRSEAQLPTDSRIASGKSAEIAHRAIVRIRVSETWQTGLVNTVAGLAGTGRVGGMPGHRHAASLLRVHNPPFEALPRRRRSSFLSHAPIVITNETREQVEPASAWDLGR